MKFGVNALFLIPGEVGGTETYVRRTLPPLAARLAPHEELVVFANAENRDALVSDLRDAPRVTVVATGLRAASRVRRVLFENLTLPRAARSLGLGALWVGDFNAAAIGVNDGLRFSACRRGAS